MIIKVHNNFNSPLLEHSSHTRRKAKPRWSNRISSS